MRVPPEIAAFYDDWMRTIPNEESQRSEYPEWWPLPGNRGPPIPESAAAASSESAAGGVRVWSDTEVAFREIEGRLGGSWRPFQFSASTPGIGEAPVPAMPRRQIEPRKLSSPLKSSWVD